MHRSWEDVKICRNNVGIEDYPWRVPDATVRSRRKSKMIRSAPASVNGMSRAR